LCQARAKERAAAAAAAQQKSKAENKHGGSGGGGRDKKAAQEKKAIKEVDEMKCHVVVSSVVFCLFCMSTQVAAVGSIFLHFI
jgi:hypothetical protein